MKINRHLLAAGLVSTIAASSIIGLQAVYAQSDTTNRHDNLIDKIATKFNINREEVEAVFNEQHDEMEQERKTKREEYLQTKVDDGTITAEQKTALLEKLDALHENMEAAREQNISREETREKLDALREELKTWADEQGIDLKELRLMGMGGMHGMHHGEKGMGR